MPELRFCSNTDLKSAFRLLKSSTSSTSRAPPRGWQKLRHSPRSFTSWITPRHVEVAAPWHHRVRVRPYLRPGPDAFLPAGALEAAGHSSRMKVRISHGVSTPHRRGYIGLALLNDVRVFREPSPHRTQAPPVPSRPFPGRGTKRTGPALPNASCTESHLWVCAGRGGPWRNARGLPFASAGVTHGHLRTGILTAAV